MGFNSGFKGLNYSLSICVEEHKLR